MTGNQRVRQLKLLAEPPLPKQKLPTNLTTCKHPVHRWFNFIAGFSPEFVSHCIQSAKLEPNEVLVDPFAGLCTALVEASFVGINSVGFESHPFFFDVGSAKVHPPHTDAPVTQIETVVSRLRPMTDDLASIWSSDGTTFLTKLVSETDLRLLAGALLLEPEIPAANRPLYRLIISRVLEHTSGSATDGIYKAPTTRKKGIPFETAFAKVCEEIRNDTPAVAALWRGQATLYHGSSEDMSAIEDGACSICVTSPPYLNNFDFAEMTRMELYFWRYARNWRDITENVRRNLIVNTTTAPSDLRKDQEKFAQLLSGKFLAAVHPTIADLKTARQFRAGKKEYDSLVIPYFAQMQSVFRELSRVLRAGGFFHLVVADAALYGVHVRTHLLFADLLEECGFENIQIERLRTRGERWVLEKRQGAADPLGEFHIYARRS
jgi:DNA modification methylase